MPSQAVVNLVVDATGADDEVNAQIRAIVNDAERNAPPININVQIDNSTVNNITNDMRRIGDSADDADRRSGRLGDTFSRVGRAAGTLAGIAGRFGAMGAAAGAAIPLVAGVAQTLATIAPAAAAGATALLTVKAASLVVQIGMQGVGDAVKAAFDPETSPEEFAESLKNLAPEARAFVTELRGMRDGFRELQLDVQNNLFRGLDDSLRRLAAEVMPTLRATALEMSESLNAMARNAATAATEVAEDGTLGRALQSGTRAMQTLEAVPGRVVTAIAQIAEAGGPVLERFATGIDSVTERLSTRLSAAVESGALTDAINNAIAALQQLGRIGSNIGDIFGNIFSIADDAGANFLDTLERITGALADVTATEEFRDALTGLLSVLTNLSTTVLPLVAQAFQIVAPIIASLAGPVNTLIDVLGEQLSGILTALDPVLQALGEALGVVLEAIAPLLEIFGQLVQELLPVLTPLIQAFSDVIAVLAPIIAEIVGQIADAFIPVIQALIPIVQLAAEFLGELAERVLPILGEIITGTIIPLLNQWLEIMLPLIEAVTPLIDVILDLVLQLAEKLVPIIGTVIGWMASFAQTILGVVGPVIRNVLIPIINGIVALLRGDFSKAWEIAKNLVSRIASTIANAVVNLGTRIKNAILSAVNYVITRFRDGFNRAREAVSRALSGIVREVGRIPSRVRSGIGNAGRILYNSGRAIIQGLINGVRSMANAAKNAAKSVLDGVRDLFPFSPAKEGPFSGRGWTLYSGQSLMEGFSDGIVKATPQTVRTLDNSLSQLSDQFTVPGTVGTQAQVAGTSLATQFRNTTADRTLTPVVNVFLGEEPIRERVGVMVDRRITARDRLVSQGVRF